jgi:hypothetical protein
MRFNSSQLIGPSLSRNQSRNWLIGLVMWIVRSRGFSAIPKTGTTRQRKLIWGTLACSACASTLRSWTELRVEGEICWRGGMIVLMMMAAINKRCDKSV